MQNAFMKTMTLRNIPDEVYEAIAKAAKEERRSMQEQVRYVLENDVAMRSNAVCERVAAYRTRLEDREFCSSVVDDIREDRDR